MSAGGGAMIRGSTTSSNRGASAREGAFTERNDGVDYPRHFDEAYKNMEALNEILDKGEVREDVLNTIEWEKPINFQNEYDAIVPTKQTAESTYLSSGTVLEFNLVIPNGNYTVPSDFELILPVRFKDENGGRLNLSRWLPVNNFFGCLIESMSVFRKDDQHPIVHPRPSGSVTSYSLSIMQHMTSKQLEVMKETCYLSKTLSLVLIFTIDLDKKMFLHSTIILGGEVISLLDLLEINLNFSLLSKSIEII